jgi:hypothetical protein
VCNNLDDDCDGKTDEGLTGCTCVPQGEQCNNVDDDCDGTTDENNPGGGAACSTGQPGICAAGTLMCSMGVLGCVANNMPAPLDLCGNNLDDNCDGVINDGCAMCGPSTYDCDLLAVNGCECNFGTGCCGSVCQYTHNAGFGASYYDCSVPGTYTSGQGLKACEATDGVGTCTFGTCAGFNVVCSSASANCKCWNVDGAAVGRAYDAPGNTCQCVTSPSSGVAWD